MSWWCHFLLNPQKLQIFTYSHIYLWARFFYYHFFYLTLPQKGSRAGPLSRSCSRHYTSCGLDLRRRLTQSTQEGEKNWAGQNAPAFTDPVQRPFFPTETGQRSLPPPSLLTMMRQKSSALWSLTFRGCPILLWTQTSCLTVTTEHCSLAYGNNLLLFWCYLHQEDTFWAKSREKLILLICLTFLLDWLYVIWLNDRNQSSVENRADKK